MGVSVEYPITRPFPGRWFAPVTYTAAAISIVLLAVLNSALTGYETITVFQGDFNATQSWWYSRWLPTRGSQPGTLCDPHVYNAGDRFTTNYTLFRWEIETINTATAGTGTTYKGATLEDCDITNLHLNGDIRTWVMDITAVVRCKAKKNQLEITARTDFTISRLPGLRTSAISVKETGFVTNNVAGLEGNPRLVVSGTLLQLATEDAGQRMWSLVQATNNTCPNVRSTEVEFTWCPASMGPDAECSKQKPTFRTVMAASVYPNSTLEFWNLKQNSTSPGLMTDDILTAYSNMVQTVHAAVRIDLGNPSPNNFILNSSATDEVLYSSFPASSGMNVSASLLYMVRKTPQVIGLQQFLPINTTGPATLEVVYLCRFQRRKSLAQGVASVIVATLSMFAGGWAVFMLIATTLTKVNNESANLCDSHAAKTDLRSYELVGLRK